MKIEIKKATLKELEAIRKMNQELFKYDYENFDKNINYKWSLTKAHKECYEKDISGKNSAVFLALINKKIVGYILCKIIDAEIYSKDKKLAFLEDMFVVKEHRSSGIGTMLVNEFLKWEKLKGVKRATVTVSIKNKKAINFYRKAGFSDQDLILERKIK